MSLLSRLERRIGWLAIPNLTLYLVLFQGVSFILLTAKGSLINQLVLDPVQVLHGEWWRLVMFLFIPPTTSFIWILFALLAFHMMGTALEHEWGTFRYNVYIFIGWLTTIATSFLPMAFGLQTAASTNLYIATSVFLAFAFLFPDYTFLVFFILPVKAKWLALLTWILYGVMLVEGDAMDRAAILAAILNFLIFFSADLIRMIRHRTWRAKNKFQQMQNAPDPEAAFHRCEVCGRTDKTNPELEFRYCPLCGGKGYCMDHIATHQHVR